MPRPAITRRQAVEAVPSHKSISDFTHVSKSQVLPDASAKRVVVELSAPSRKRKAGALGNDEETTSMHSARRTISFPPSSDDEDDQTTVAKRACRRADPTPVAVPPVSAKGRRIAKATSSKAKKVHRPSQSTIIAKAVHQEKNVQTKITSIYQRKVDRVKANKDDRSLPPHLADLVTLNKAFLKTAAVQIAHSGCCAPIDLRALLPQISRTWGKRQVTVEDIRRCIAIQACSKEDAASPFIVSDYGRGRVCVELASGISASSINEDRLCRQFQDNIRNLCSERATDEMTDVDVPLGSLSLSDLPKAAITDMGNGMRTNPVLAKGQQALTELKNGVAAKQLQQKQDKQHLANHKNPLLNPDGSKMSLLDRIRHKQLAKANSPAPPSGPELQRRAALDRVSDVAATISMLSLSNPLSLPRQAFTMVAIADKLKDSAYSSRSRIQGGKHGLCQAHCQ